MSERQKQITNVLFWLAFGVFLGVSIPHIAWIVRDYMPVADWVTDKFYWILALGYAIAIDGIMAWLTHAQSSQKASLTWQTFLTWVFIVALVGMSWYLNWLYDAIHDPSQHYKNIWDFVLIDHWWFIPQVTVAGFTPVLLGALPVFTIAYVGVLNNVNHIKTQATKTVDQLRQEAEEIEERTKYLNRIKNAGKSDEDKAGNAVKGVFGLVKKVKDEAQELAGEKRVKQDPQMMKLEKVVSFYRNTPHLLTEEEHASSTELMIKDMLKLRKVEQAHAWRVQAAEILRLEQTKVTAQDSPVAVEVEAEVELPPPALPPHLDENKLQLTLDFLTVNPNGTDEELARHLELNRPSSARFWRLQAIEFLRRNGTNLPSTTELTDEAQRNSGGTEDGRDTGPLASVNEEANVISGNDDLGTVTDAQTEVADDELFQDRGTESSSQSSITHTSAAKFSRRKPMTIMEVAAVLECTDRHVRNLRSKGQLVPDEDDKNLITAGSVKAYIESRKKAKVS